MRYNIGKGSGNMDIIKVKQQATKILEKNESVYKAFYTIIITEALKKTGLNKEKLIEEINKISNPENLKDIDDGSIASKQILGKIITTDEKERKQIINELIEYISNLEEENGTICVEISPKTDAFYFGHPNNNKKVNYIQKNSDETLEIETENELTNKIKIKFEEEYGDVIARIMEPKISIDEKDSCEIIFDTLEEEKLPEFKNNIISYVEIFNKVIDRRKEIVESLYKNLLGLYLEWQDNGWKNEIEIDIDYVKATTQVLSIKIFKDSAQILAYGYDERFIDEETEGFLLGDHDFCGTITVEELNLEKLDMFWKFI